MDPTMKRCTGCGALRDNTRRKCKCGCYAHAYEPTVEEIQLACQAIQATWSASERERRQVEAYRAVEWLVPAASQPEDGRRRRKGDTVR